MYSIRSIRACGSFFLMILVIHTSVMGLISEGPIAHTACGHLIDRPSTYLPHPDIDHSTPAAPRERFPKVIYRHNVNKIRSLFSLLADVSWMSVGDRSVRLSSSLDDSKALFNDLPQVFVLGYSNSSPVLNKTGPPCLGTYLYAPERLDKVKVVVAT